MGAANQPDTEDLPETVQRILRAAEQEFAERGFEGAGMKAIATRGEVSQALLHYHFGNKDHLYSEVIRHRSRLINEERENLLAAVGPEGPDAVPGILDALFRPPLGPAGGDQAYTRIFGGLVVGRERDRALVRECYDPTAQRFITALKTALGVSRQTAALCYTLSLGTLVVMIARDGRVERLMGRDGQQSTEEMLDQLITYASGGIEALTRSEKRPS